MVLASKSKILTPLFFIIFLINTALGSGYKIEHSTDTSTVIQLIDSARNLVNTQPKISKRLLDKALYLSDELRYQRGKAQTFNNLGILSFQKGIIDSASHYFNLSLQQWKLLNNDKQVSNLYNNLSVILGRQKKLAKAIEYNKKSLEFKIKFNDTILIANGYNNLGNLYHDLGNIEEALYFQRKSLKLRIAVKDTARLPHSYVNLGDLYNLTGQLDSARYYGKNGLALQIINNDQWGIANSYGVLAEYHYLKKELDSASFLVDMSLSIAEEIGLAHILEEMILLKSNILLQQQNFNEALQILSKQQEYINTELGISSLKTFAQIYKKKGDNKQATVYYKKYNNKNDSLQTANLENRIAEMTANHFYELQELEKKNQRNLKASTLQQIVNQKQQETSRLWLIIGLLALAAIVFVLSYSSIKQKNKVLNKQRKEIDQLVTVQKEVIEARTSELVSNQDAISKYTFLNSHELKAPLSKILKIINSPKEKVEDESFFLSLKEVAEELEAAVRKISKALHKK